MIIITSTRYATQSKKLLKKRPNLKEKVSANLKLLETDRNNPKLKLHKLTGNQKENWAISIEENIRLIFCYIPEGILLLAIGKHEEVY